MTLPASAPPIRVPRSRVEETHRRLAVPIREALDRVLFGGPRAATETVEAFETAFAAATGRRFAVGVQSGTAGLFLALRAAGVGPGDEVITVANTDISTLSAVTHCGATPVLCDILLDDYTMDVDRATRLITPRTRALLPVDLYGHPADARALRTLAEAHGLWLIEDACLAAGARDHGRPVGEWAHLTVFSFNGSKPLGGIGNGGAVVTDDPQLAGRVRHLRGYGADLLRGTEPGGADAAGKYAFTTEGYNLPLEGPHAAVLGVKLPYLEEWTSRRRAIAASYAARLAGEPVGLPTFRAEAEPTFRQYTVRVARRDAVFARMRHGGVDVVLHYVPPMHQQPVYRDRRFPGSDDLPVTERAAEELLCLPVSPELTEEDVEVVVETLRHAVDPASSGGM
ncbi:MAG: DegT/DnrJ/EryC1/StrS family aminotransferase [Armatimonadota bacterium]|nr:DegT/DnrJ/EryC1/StrS family aminotransferase [Armatimonadota bacterium]